MVALADRGKGEGMPIWANNPSDKAREPENELSIVAKLGTGLGGAIDSQEPSGLTIPVRMARAWVPGLNACGMGRPSVSRVLEIGMHGLKGGFRSPGRQRHRA